MSENEIISRGNHYIKLLII